MYKMYYSNYNELYHYGVLGMKWGHHKYASKEDKYSSKERSHIDKIQSSRTRLGKNYHNFMAFYNRSNLNTRRSIEKDRGHLLRQIGNAYGHGYNASVQNAASDYYARKSQYSKTRFGRTANEARSFNNKTAAQANERLHNSKNPFEYGRNYIDSMQHRKIKTMAGRTTTTGKRALDLMLTGGFGGMALDIYYYSSNRKKG